MEIEYLKTFIEVVETGSITGVSRSSGLSVSTVSNRLNKTEEFFGRKLLVRGREGVRPTEEGRLVIEEIKHLLGHVDVLQRPEDLKAPDTREGLRIAIGEGGCRFDYTRELLNHLRERPLLFERSADTCMELLHRKEVDLGVMCLCDTLSEEVQSDASLLTGYLCNEDLICVAPEDAEPASRGPLHVKRLSELPLIGLGGGDSPVERHIQGTIGKAGLDREVLNYVYRTVSPRLQFDMVSRSYGFALTTSFLYGYYSDKVDGITPLEVEGLESRQKPIYTVCPPEEGVRPETLKLVESLHRTFKTPSPL